jgi:hypothetical protein
MNTKESVKTRVEAVEKRYGKTLKGTTKKVKIRVKVKPVLKKNKVGLNIKATF